MTSLKIVNLTKNYGDVKALSDFSLNVDSGELAVLLGPSGCGKTTVVRCIAGLLDESGGQIFIGDQLVNGLQPKDRDVAMVFQNYALYPHMSIYSNIAFPLKMKKYSKKEIEKEVSKVAELLGITNLLERMPRELSGGQMQRVALGRALVRKPKVFLMDEPLSNLDAKLRLHMRTEIKKLQKRVGITTLYITHDQVEAMSMADKIVVMDSGNIQQIGTPDDIYNVPSNMFVAGFVGSPTMNFINFEINKTDKFTCYSDAGVDVQLPSVLQQALHEDNVPERITVGIRPRDIDILDTKEGFEGLLLSGKVSFIESLGDDSIIEVNIRNINYDTNNQNVHSEFTIKIASANPFYKPRNKHLDIGDTVKMGVNFKRLHLFDSLTGDRIEIKFNQPLQN